MNAVKHLDLFSGIGGFSLAARWMGWQTIGFCEIDKYCQKVLKKNFPSVPIVEDIRNVTRQSFPERPNIITGGFPCQPFSSLGHRQGKDDNRYLWKETMRAISTFRPAWFVGENVIGIITVALDEVLADLESEGYAAQTFVIPACAVNAPHERNRIWIVGNSESRRLLSKPVHSGAGIEIDLSKREAITEIFAAQSLWKGANTGSDRNGDGLSVGLDGLGKRIGKDGRYSPRTESEFRLHALGNAIVPQVAYEIFKAIETL